MARKFNKNTNRIVLVDVFPPKGYNEEAHCGEPWANEVISGLDILFADYDGTTTGDPEGINLLLPESELQALEAQCKAMGAEGPCVTSGFDPGEFADSHTGVQGILAETEIDAEPYWIWLEINEID